MDNQQEEVKKLKDQGNKFFSQKEYKNAIQQYSQALEIDPQNDVILSNRAQAYLNLQNYFEAYKDSQESLNINQNNNKSFFRLIHSLKGLQKYKQAIELLTQALENNKEIKNWYKQEPQKYQSISLNQLKKLQRQQNGMFDLKEYYQELKKNQNKQVEIANYVDKIEIKYKNQQFGRGIYAKRHFKKGEIIMVQRPIVSFDENNSQDKSLIEKFQNSEQNTVIFDTQNNKSITLKPIEAGLLHKFQEQLWNDQVNLLRVNYLYYGQKNIKNYVPPSINIFTHNYEEYLEIGKKQQLSNKEQQNLFGNLQMPKNLTKIMDKDKAYQIIHRNSFSFTSLQDKDCTGIYIISNFFNHSCLNNAQQFFIGDVMFIRAVKDIDIDEEILLDYVQYDGNFCLASMRDSFLQKTKQFACLCEMCDYQINNIELLDFTEDFFLKYQDEKMKEEAIEQLLQPDFNQQIMENLQYFPALQAILAQIYTIYDDKKVEDIEKIETSIPKFNLNKMNIYFQGIYFHQKLKRIIEQLAKYWKDNNDKEYVAQVLNKLCIITKKFEEIQLVYHGYAEDKLIEFMGPDLYGLYKKQASKIQSF